MKVKVLEGFVGSVSGSIGEEITIDDKHIRDELIRSGYVEPLETTTHKRQHKKPVEINED